MENFLSEHGEIILYGLIGIMVVVITCGLCKNKWNQITPEYKNEKSQSNEKFLKESKDKYPVIEGQEVIYLAYCLPLLLAATIRYLMQEIFTMWL